MYFQKRVGDPGEKPKAGAHPPRPHGPASKAQRRAAGTRAGRRAQPGRARPQARLIFMSTGGAPPPRPAGGTPAPAAGLLCPPPARPPSLRTRAQPLCPRRAPPPSLRPRASAGRGGGRERPRRARLSLSTRPPAAPPCPPRRKVKQTRTGASTPSRSTPGPASPRTRARLAHSGPSGRTSRRYQPPRRAPRPPPPADLQTPPRPAPAGPGLSAAAGGRGRGGGRDSPLASPGRGRGRARAPAIAK